jgi:predicted Rossmann fold nucleotide-binding protein DprA/Smf involved in DNA uptake
MPIETNKFYSAIGSRKTPIEIGKIQAKLAFKLSQENWIMRSGGAWGSDKFFELGVDSSKKQKRIYTTK